MNIRLLAALLAAAVIPACGAGGSKPAAAGPSGPVVDFLLQDLNPNSATYNTGVSPRDFLAQVPAFYFGHAT